MRSIPPVRICCGQRHYGARCPDDLVMCCHCFDRFSIDELAVDESSGDPIDVCKPCALLEQLRITLDRIPYTPPRPIKDVDIRGDLL